jgi:hypothetical protein
VKRSTFQNTVFFILYCDQQTHNYFTNYHTPARCFLCFLNFIRNLFLLHSLSFFLYFFMFHLSDFTPPFRVTLLPNLSFILFVFCSSFVCSFYTFSSSLYFFPLPPGPFITSKSSPFHPHFVFSTVRYYFLFSSCSPQTVEL